MADSGLEQRPFEDALTKREQRVLYWHLMETMEGAEFERVLDGIVDKLPEHEILTHVPDEMPEDHRREVVCMSCGTEFVAYAAEIRNCSDCRGEPAGAEKLPVIVEDDS